MMLLRVLFCLTWSDFAKLLKCFGHISFWDFYVQSKFCKYSLLLAKCYSVKMKSLLCVRVCGYGTVVKTSSLFNSCCEICLCDFQNWSRTLTVQCVFIHQFLC